MTYNVLRKTFRRAGLLVLLFFALAAVNLTALTAYAADEENEPAVDAELFKNERVLNLKCESFAENEIVVKWDEVKSAEKYEIWKFNNVTNGYDKVDETDKTTYKFEKLERGQKLSVLVRAYITVSDEKVYGLFSDMLPCATIPENVTGLTVTKTTAASVSLSWNMLSPDCSYKITRCAEGSTLYENVATVTGNTYTDAKAASATPYTYKIYALVPDTEARSVEETSIVTCTPPVAAFIKQFKGGSYRARIRWNKIEAGDGYILYIRDAFGHLVEAARINNLEITEYTHTGLVNDAVYRYMIIPYKIYNGVEYKAEESNEIAVTVIGSIATQSKAAVYSKVSKLKKSKVYKKYNDFSKCLNLGKSFIIPGIKLTNNIGFKAEKMVSQAVCFAGNYMLVSAYDGVSEETSVVYVLNKKTRKYICTLSLPDYYHAGGIAYDGLNIWVSTGKAVSCFTIMDVEAAVKSGEDSYPIIYKTTCPVKTQASFVTYYKNKLWIGEHKETSSSKMYSYRISGKKSASPVLTKDGSMKIPSRTQDVLFLKNGKMIVSCSNQVSAKKSKYYISQLMLYKPDWKNSKGTYVKAGKCAGIITMPPMAEGIAYKSGYVYVSFESAAISGCSQKMDRICALKYSKIKWK